MIERYFRPGVRFLWNKPQDAIGPLNGALVANAGAATPMTYDGLDGHRAAVDPQLLIVQASNILGIAKGANVAYSWLDYAPGRISRLPVGGGDVLSGYMSGCLIARGTNAGAMCAFHVGTIDGNPGVNTTVKTAFAGMLPADVTGFNPGGAWNLGEATTAQTRLGGTAGAAKILALITSGGAFYSILMVPVQEGGSFTNAAGRQYWCVGGIKAVPAMNLAAVQASLA